METLDLRSFDGTRLTVYRAGNPDGPPMILANGLGGNIVSWRPFIRAFSGHFRIYCWDYRGLYRSDPAPTLDSYSIEHHARDLAELIDALGIAKPVLVGWSMGVQVNLELMRTRPEVAAAVIALNGTPGKPFDTAFDSRFFERRFEPILAAIRQHWRRAMALRPLMERDAVIEAAVRAFQLSGLASRTLDRQIFRDLAYEWIDIDVGIYAWIFDQLGRHDASDVLESVGSPTLVVAGQKDRFTPAHRSRLMAGRIPDAELYVVPRATHFCPVEYPELVNRRVRRFLRERGLLPLAPATAESGERRGWARSPRQRGRVR